MFRTILSEFPPEDLIFKVLVRAREPVVVPSELVLEILLEENADNHAYYQNKHKDQAHRHQDGGVQYNLKHRNTFAWLFALNRCIFFL